MPSLVLPGTAKESLDLGGGTATDALSLQANPPRSIWTHPLDDPEFQRTSQGNGGGYQPPPGPPPSHSESTDGQQSSHTYPNEKATYSASPAPALSHSNSVGSSSGQQYGGADKTKSGGGGLFGKIKAKINEVKQPRPQQYGGGGYGGGGYGGQQQYGGYPQQGYGQQQQYGGYQQQGRMGGGMMGGGGRMGGGGGMNPVRRSHSFSRFVEN